MLAAILEKPKEALILKELPIPQPQSDEVLIKVLACGVCRTDLHVVDGELPNPLLPIIPGHEIVGQIIEKGSAVQDFQVGTRVVVPWLAGTCGHCAFCLEQKENLCDAPLFTGYTRNGGFAEYTVAQAQFCIEAPENYSDINLAPLVCAGLIGFRSYKFAGEGQNIGIYGFGAAAHILTQIAREEGKNIFAFTRPEDKTAQSFATSTGALWSGGSNELPPVKLDSAIIFAPAGPLVPQALKALKKGGKLILGGIHMSDIPGFPYDLIWQERSIQTVANLTRQDAREFLELSKKIKINTQCKVYNLPEAQKALDDLRAGRFSGAAVLVP